MANQVIFLGSKITMDDDCSHEIKRHLLLGRKAITNLGSVFKSRDIILPTKVCLVQAIVSPEVRYGCESWTIKKAEWQRVAVFKLWFWRRLLRVPWTLRRSNQSIIKEINSEYSLEGPKLKLQNFGHLMQKANLLEKILMLGKTDSRRRRMWQKVRWLDSIIDSMNMNLSKFQEIMKDREAWCGAVHGIAKNWTQLKQQYQPVNGTNESNDLSILLQ